MDFSRDNFSFTIQIPAFKRVMYKNKAYEYGRLSQSQQYELLEGVLSECVKGRKIIWVYEEHQDKRLHIHGMIFDEIEECARDFILDVYRHYAIHINSYKKIFGDERNAKMCDFQKTIKDIRYFMLYMQKHQDQIKYFQRRQEEERESSKLDGRPMQILEDKKPDLPDEFIYDLEYNYPYRELSDKYPFGKTKKINTSKQVKIIMKKFLVEL